MTETTPQPWWQTAVFYQIYPRSFMDTNGDGVGDLTGIIQKLDYLKGAPDSLGIDAIWLSPVNPSPQSDFGYDVQDYCDIDPLFGDMATFRRLIFEAHKRDIKVIMDLVVNHTSSEHPWFKASQASKNNSKRDWYIWRDGVNGSPPNNWQSVFGGPAWEWDDQTQQYYLHLFLKDQPDLNWRNPAVQEAVWETMRFWLDCGVDGFRLDVYNFYFKDETLRSNPKRRSFTGLFYKYAGQHHIYDQDQPEMYSVLEKMRSIVDSYPGNRMLVGETSSDNVSEKAFSYYGENQNGLNLVFNFEFLQSHWRARDFHNAIQHWLQYAPKNSWPTWVLSNHDVRRHFARYSKWSKRGEARAKVATTMLLTLKGTPFLYYGEEIGMTDHDLPRRLIQDPPGKKFWPFFKGRDGCRTPMQWNTESHAGFSSAPPWLPVNQDYREVNVATMQQSDTSLFWHYKNLIALRRVTPALTSGTMEIVEDVPANVLLFTRSTPDDTLWIGLNFSRRKTVVKLNFSETLKIVLATRHLDGTLFQNGEMVLEPDEAVICRKIK